MKTPFALQPWELIMLGPLLRPTGRHVILVPFCFLSSALCLRCLGHASFERSPLPSSHLSPRESYTLARCLLLSGVSLHRPWHGPLTASLGGSRWRNAQLPFCTLRHLPKFNTAGTPVCCYSTLLCLRDLGLMSLDGKELYISSRCATGAARLTF